MSQGQLNAYRRLGYDPETRETSFYGLPPRGLQYQVEENQTATGLQLQREQEMKWLDGVPAPRDTRSPWRKFIDRLSNNRLAALHIDLGRERFDVTVGVAGKAVPGLIWKEGYLTISEEVRVNIPVNAITHVYHDNSPVEYLMPDIMIHVFSGESLELETTMPIKDLYSGFSVKDCTLGSPEDLSDIPPMPTITIQIPAGHYPILRSPVLENLFASLATKAIRDRQFGLGHRRVSFGDPQHDKTKTHGGTGRHMSLHIE